MLQKTYSIYSDDLINQHLYIEVGKNHLACWMQKAAEKKFAAFEFFQCADYDGSTFENLINEARLYSKLLTLDVSDITLKWHSEKNLIIPAAINGDDKFIKDNFSLLYGVDESDKILARNYTDYFIVTSVDKYLYNAAHNVFPKANFQPAYPVKNKLPAGSAELFFYPYVFSFVMYADNGLQFFQTKSYRYPEDVLYFILNVFHQYNIAKNTTVLTGGFVDKHSALFETLYQYLEGLELGSIDEALFASPEYKEYPPHYFLPYINYLL